MILHNFTWLYGMLLLYCKCIELQMYLRWVENHSKWEGWKRRISAFFFAFPPYDILCFFAHSQPDCRTDCSARQSSILYLFCNFNFFHRRILPINLLSGRIHLIRPDTHIVGLSLFQLCKCEGRLWRRLFRHRFFEFLIRRSCQCTSL